MSSPDHRPTEHTQLTPHEIGPDGFVAEVVLDGWQRRGSAQRVGGVLWLEGDRVHDVVDAVRVLGRRNGESDPYGWTGRVFPLRELLRLGASLGPDGCKLGAAAYDVEFGVLVEQQPVAEPERTAGRPDRPSTGTSLIVSRPPTGGFSRPATGGASRTAGASRPVTAGPSSPVTGGVSRHPPSENASSQTARPTSSGASRPPSAGIGRPATGTVPRSPTAGLIIGGHRRVS